MRLLNCLYVLLFFLFNNCAISQENQSMIESSALSFVKTELIKGKQLLDYNNSFLKEYSIDLNGLLDDRVKFYTSGRTCELSTVGRIEEDFKNNSQALYEIRGLNYDRKDKEESKVMYTEYALPLDVQRVNLEEFKGLRDTDGFFITVLHHLEFNGIYLVEINIAKFDQIPNLSQYTFYVQLNKELEITDWDFVEGYDPEHSDGCEKEGSTSK